MSLEILNLQAADNPSARGIGRARRVAFKTAHPDLLMGSPELISDPVALGMCLLEEAIHLRGYIETASLALTLAVDAAWEPAKNRVEYKLPPRRPPLERARSPTGGGGREPPTPPTVAPQRAAPRATATSGAPPRPPESPRARSDHKAARQAAQNEATRVRREQDARRRRQERYQAEQPQPEPPPPRMARLKLGSGVGWRSDNRHFRILAGCGAGAPQRKFLGYDSVEPIFCHYADVSRLGT